MRSLWIFLILLLIAFFSFVWMSTKSISPVIQEASRLSSFGAEKEIETVRKMAIYMETQKVNPLTQETWKANGAAIDSIESGIVKKLYASLRSEDAGMDRIRYALRDETDSEWLEALFQLEVIEQVAMADHEVLAFEVLRSLNVNPRQKTLTILNAIQKLDRDRDQLELDFLFTTANQISEQHEESKQLFEEWKRRKGY